MPSLRKDSRTTTIHLPFPTAPDMKLFLQPWPTRSQTARTLNKLQCHPFRSLRFHFNQPKSPPTSIRSRNPLLAVRRAERVLHVLPLWLSHDLGGASLSISTAVSSHEADEEEETMKSPPGGGEEADDCPFPFHECAWPTSAAGMFV
mmetsp:Transcript_32218/g.63935  ORF Transcript_32218/g.63935 Transcript_32218/m.63935 type:complete len:147 (+) Transcript_32218:587-1027(+)